MQIQRMDSGHSRGRREWDEWRKQHRHIYTIMSLDCIVHGVAKSQTQLSGEGVCVISIEPWKQIRASRHVEVATGQLSLHTTTTEPLQLNQGHATATPEATCHNHRIHVPQQKILAGK